MRLYDEDDGLVRFDVGDRVRLRRSETPKGFDSPITGVMHEVSGNGNGGLVKHDDGKIYGWAFLELEYVPPERSTND